MSLNTYEEYCDVDNEWIGEIPSHWNVSPLKRLAELIVEQAEKPLYQVGLEHIESWSGNLTGTTTEFTGDGINFREGDILFGKLRPYLAKVHLAQSKGAAVGDFFVLRPTNIDAAYLHKYILNPAVIRELNASTIGAKMPRVSWSDMALLPVAHPPKNEQRRIAAFLDHETAKIDALVAEQKRLIELLKEKRQAVIFHAVTKGLDPNVPMKDSTSEFFDEIPEHWRESRLKHEAVLIVDCPHETPTYDAEGSYLVIRTADIERGHLERTAMRRIDHAQYILRTRRSKVNRGDIVYGREGERWGHAALVPESDLCCLGQRMMQIRVQNWHDQRFMMWQLNAFALYAQGAIDIVGATSPHVNVDTIRNYHLVFPSRLEQKAITEHLEGVSQHIDVLIASAEKSIALLNERRSALISAAVTGKIDVRDWQPPTDKSAAGSAVQSVEANA